MPRHFDNDLPRVGSDKLKPMVKIWGGDSKMRKEECIVCICAGLKDPHKVQAALARLEPWERNALALIKRMGGVISNNALKIGILTSGLHPRRVYTGYRYDDFIDTLFRRGLLLAMDTYGPDYITESYGGGTLYSDERILAHVGFPEILPFEIQPTHRGSSALPASNETLYRRPSTVSLDIMGMLQAIENIGGLKLTQSGTVRVSDESKLRKVLRWDETGIELDGFFFPNPVQAWLGAFSCSDLLQKMDNDQLVLKESPERFAQRPFGEQVRLLMEGLIRTHTWWEAPPKNTYMDNDGKGRRQGRLALTLALSALPLNPDAFFSIHDFDLALYKRIGEDFALDYLPQRPSFFRATTPEQKERDLADWREKTRNEWLNQERPWLEGAFTTWLYFLGLVELTIENGEVTGFRLTDIGRATFHPELDSASTAESAPQAPGQPIWVVQPNFEIIAYLDRVSAPQLAFLERHAERTQSQRHTAHYRLTRESVYRGLESGSSLDDFVKTLQLGSQSELSQNVLVELREWASLRERIVLRRSARLMEFQSAEALKTGLTQGLTGAIVAERFLLLDAAPPSSGWKTIDYAKLLPPNLTLTETGLIHWKPVSHDLITAAQLTQWAEATPEGGWQLTPESVTIALKPGKKLTELLALLQSRVFPNIPAKKYNPVEPSIPPLLEIALRSWASGAYQVELESVIVLRCPDEQVFRAILGSPMMKTFLAGYLHPNLLFVDTQHLDALRTQLDWLGWKVSEHLEIIPFHGATARRI